MKNQFTIISKNMGPILSLFLFLLLLLLTLLFLMKHKNNGNRLPPGPPKLPIIGNLHQLGPLPHRLLQRLSRTHGPVMLLRLGGTTMVVVSSAEAAREVLKTHDSECCSRPALAGPAKLSYNFQDVGFAPYSDHWREMRRVCVLKLFSQKSVESFRSIREDEIRSLVESLRRRSSGGGGPVDLSGEMFALTAGVTLRAAFGSTFSGSGLDRDGFVEMVKRAQSVLGSFTASDFFPNRFGRAVDRLTGLSSKLERSFRELDGFYERVIEEHLSKSTTDQGEDEDMVDLLLRVERDQSENMFTRDCSKAILMDIFLAGVDTGAITLTWAMTELVRNPRVMKKAQNEIRTYAKDGKFFREDDIMRLQYLKMVVKETLRLHSPVPLLIPRETMSQIKLLDYEVPAKTLLQVNVWAIGRDPTYWNNPEEFFPERFSDGSIDYKGQNFEFLPFGAGRRGCPGIRMGLAVVELVLANLLCCFDWKLPDGMNEMDIDMDEAYGLTAYKKSPLKLVPISYRSP